MIFCKGDISSVRVVCDCIQIFSNTSGLQANSNKSAVYTTGVHLVIKEAIGHLTQFTSGSFPFRYLGVPLTSKRLSIADCEHLADRMTSRIKCWHSKSLSYAARVQFINSVLIGISSYWCQIFIIPKRVIRQINSICRSFLWFGIFDSHKPGKLKWEDVCKPIKVGGLGDAITQDEFLLGNA